MKDYLKKKSIMGAIRKHIFDLLTFLLHRSTIFKINCGVLFPMSRQAKRILICLISLPKLHEQNISSCYRTRLDSLFFGRGRWEFQIWYCTSSAWWHEKGFRLLLFRILSCQGASKSRFDFVWFVCSSFWLIFSYGFFNFWWFLATKKWMVIN